MTLTRHPIRSPVAIAALSLAVIIVAYTAVPLQGRPRELVADVALTWSALFAAVCCLAAWRGLRGRPAAPIWAWMAAGCAVWLLGQLAWDDIQLLHQLQPPYPSLADVGFLGIYFCFVGAVTNIVRDQPVRPAAPELTLDLVLVGVTLAAIAIELVVVPATASTASPAAILVSIGWAAGGIAVVWLLLREMLLCSHYPLATAGLLSLGLCVFSVTNVAYGAFELTRTFPPGDLLDLGWVAGFLVIAVAAAQAVDRAPAPPATLPLGPSTGRTIAVAVALSGLIAVGISAALDHGPDPVSAVLIALGGIIITMRLFFALRLDQRYTVRLEHEVAARTHSLQTLMGAVPDTILVLDADGRILETNLRYRATASSESGRREADLIGRSVFDLIDQAMREPVRAHLAAAVSGAQRQFETTYLAAPGADPQQFSVVLARVPGDGGGGGGGGDRSVRGTGRA